LPAKLFCHGSDIVHALQRQHLPAKPTGSVAANLQAPLQVGRELRQHLRVPATAKALSRAGLKLKDMDLIELNEAFAAQVLACTREWKFAPADFDRLNVHGSGISLGYPVGATGGRILATLLREMSRRGVRYGLETMCIGGGQGITAIFENASRR
jgi:acetyl-CoA acetyltransferase